MTQTAIDHADDIGPAARGALAAAGPVEPHTSPKLAPGPTLAARGKSRADYFGNRRTQALVNQARALYRRGERYSSIARALGVTPDTARRWLDPEYDAHRRSRVTHGLAEISPDDANLPTLPFIPGLIVSGRYRMRPQVP